MNNKLAVIGIDGAFADNSNIDRVERAFYKGLATGLNPSSSQSAYDWTESVNRLAEANQLSTNDIAVIIVSEEALNIDSEKNYSSCKVVTNLGEALEHACQMLDLAIAIIGISGASEVQIIEENKATFAYDQDFNAYQKVAGVASVLISSTDFATSNSSYIYSWIKAFDCNEDIALASATAIKNSGFSAEQIELLEVSALEENDLSRAEVNGLIETYSDSQPLLNTAISCAKSVTGEGGGFSQLSGLVKTVIALQQNYIPGIADWTSPAEDALDKWQASTFYFPTEARPWYPNPKGLAHIAAYSCMTKDSYCHLVLQENQAKDLSSEVRANGYLACSNLSLFIIGFDDKNQLLSTLDSLESRCNDLVQANSSTENLTDIAKQFFKQFAVEEDQPYRLCLIAESFAELAKEISLAQIGVIKSLNENTDWKTPKGSYFSSTPVGSEHNIAFYYPGIGATYVGLGRDLFHLFPKIYQPVAALAEDIGSTLKDRLINPRSLSALSFKEKKQLDSDLRNSLAHIAECGVAFACVFTKIFEEVFDLYADYSAGYSMGEVSMYAALGCWQQPGLMSARLANSETFNNHLSGELSTLRTLWDLKEDQSEGQLKNKIWETYSIRATLDQVIEASADEDRVYCTIVNTPDNLLIGGYPEACERVIKNLGIRSMAMDMPNAIHSEPAHADIQDMEQLFTMDVTERINTKMFSSSCYLPIPHRSKAIAHSIAKCLCDQVDFPRLVTSLHDKGARVFIEMGPGRSLCSWSEKIFKADNNKPHATVPVNAKGTSDELTYIRALAKLVSHGVKLDLKTIFEGSIIVTNNVITKEVVKN